MRHRRFASIIYCHIKKILFNLLVFSHTSFLKKILFETSPSKTLSKVSQENTNFTHRKLYNLWRQQKTRKPNFIVNPINKNCPIPKKKLCVLDLIITPCHVKLIRTLRTYHWNAFFTPLKINFTYLQSMRKLRVKSNTYFGNS